MKKKAIIICILFCVAICACGCNHVDNSKEGIIINFQKNEQIFEKVADYICNFDMSPYKKDVDEDDAIYANFAVSDFKKEQYNMVIEGGDFTETTYYREIPVTEDIKVAVQKIFDLNYAFICQINAKDANQVIYFRLNDVKDEESIPHGIMYVEGQNIPDNFHDYYPITYVEHIDGNWYYYEEPSYSELESIQ